MCREEGAEQFYPAGDPQTRKHLCAQMLVSDPALYSRSRLPEKRPVPGCAGATHWEAQHLPGQRADGTGLPR